MARKIITKDADETLDYTIDYGTNWLETGETISTSVWVVPSGITNVSDSNANTTTTIVLSGGTTDSSYKLVNRITTTGGSYEGRIRDMTLIVRIKDR